MDLIYVEEEEAANLWLLSAPRVNLFPSFPLSPLSVSFLLP